MRILAFFFAVAFFISGCATGPALPKIESSRGDRIGILIEAGDQPTHTHFGTTAQSSFSKIYPLNWNLSTEVALRMDQIIRSNGLEPVDLRKSGVGYDQVSGLIQFSEDKWTSPPDKQIVLRRLKDELKLKAVILLKEERVTAERTCSPYGCSNQFANASGLYSRNVLGSTSYSAVAAYRWNVFVLDSISDTTRAEPLQSAVAIPATVLRGFQDPKEIKELSEAVLAQVKPAILQIVENTTNLAIKTLNVR